MKVKDGTIGRSLWLIVLLLFSWGVMVFTHELGHLIGGYLGGGKLIDADLRPWRLPYSFHEPDPQPLLTLWCGPLFGVIAPTIPAVLLRKQLTLFVASFCSLANGLYIGVGYFMEEPQLDTPRLLEAGASNWSIALFSIVTIGMGYGVFRRSVTVLLSEDRRVERSD